MSSISIRKRNKVWKGVVAAALAFASLTIPGKMTFAADEAFDEPLNALNENSFYASDGWENGPEFDAGWKAANVEFNNGIMALRLDKEVRLSRYAGKGLLRLDQIYPSERGAGYPIVCCTRNLTEISAWTNSPQ